MPYSSDLITEFNDKPYFIINNMITGTDKKTFCVVNRIIEDMDGFWLEKNSAMEKLVLCKDIKEIPINFEFLIECARNSSGALMKRKIEAVRNLAEIAKYDYVSFADKRVVFDNVGKEYETFSPRLFRLI